MNIIKIQITQQTLKVQRDESCMEKIGSLAQGVPGIVQGTNRRFFI